MARRFYAPDEQTGEIVHYAVNDTKGLVSPDVAARPARISGEVWALDEWSHICPVDTAIEISRLPSDERQEDAFVHFQWSDDSGDHCGENEYLPRRPKDHDPGTSRLTAETGLAADGVPQAMLKTDRPAFWVTWDRGGDTIWVDNCVTLLPGHLRIRKALRRRRTELPFRTPELRALKGL